MGDTQRAAKTVLSKYDDSISAHWIDNDVPVLTSVYKHPVRCKSARMA